MERDRPLCFRGQYGIASACWLLESLYRVRDGYGSAFLFCVICVIEVILGLDEGGKSSSN